MAQLSLNEGGPGSQFAKVMSDISDLAPWLTEQAARVEASRRIPDDVAERLTECGLFRMTQPVQLGGLGLPPHEAWDIVFEAARACSSSAWVVGLVAANLMMLSRFSIEAQRDVFLCGKPAVVPMLTGGVGRNIQVDRTDGGLRLSGNWFYASGIDIASWVGLLINVPSEDGGIEEPYVVLVPKDNFAIDHESWHVLGMRGTGSKAISLPPTFVPAHRWMSWSVLQSEGSHPTSPNRGPLHKFPLNTVFAMSVLAPTLGVGSAVSEEFCRVVRSRITPGTLQNQLEDKPTQIEAAAGVATMTLMRDSLRADASSILDGITDGHLITTEVRAAARMKMALASRMALHSAQDMFAALGGSLLVSGSRIERLFRDVHAMSSHFLLQPNPIGEAYGRLLLGLPLPPNARL